MSDDIGVAPLAPDGAEALVALIRRAYGESYADEAMYLPAEVARRLSTGRLRSVVARTASGRVVGHMAMMMRHPDDISCDAGMTIVDPDFRGHRLSGRLGDALGRVMADAGMVAYHHYPVTVNTVTQRLGLDSGGVEAGMLLSHISEAATAQQARVPTTRRSAALVLYQPLDPASPSRVVHLPRRHDEIVVHILDMAGLDREFRPGLAGPPTGPTEATLDHETSRGRALVTIERVGSDVSVSQALVDALRHSPPVVQIDVRLDDPSAPWAIEQLRALRFGFAAVLPEYRLGDVCRLQRLTTVSGDTVLGDTVLGDTVLGDAVETDTVLGDMEPARLVSDAGRRLWDYAWADQRSVIAEHPGVGRKE